MNKTIWFAGGCFWGVEAFFGRVPGVVSTEAGYANGVGDKPKYREIGITGHAETVKIDYDPEEVGLNELIELLFDIIDPTSVDKQGNDVGTQYRSGVYYDDDGDLPQILDAFEREKPRHTKPLAIKAERLRNWYPAETYHQKYLDKNPGGYCHIDFSKLPQRGSKKYPRPSDEELRKRLTPMQYAVTRENETEPPFNNEFWDHRKRGIYVDIITGEPLFASTDKFDSGCGWPSFSKPIAEASVEEKEDRTHGMRRTEVRSKAGGAHLGHVFNDGPKEAGGLRYCINSASLRFVPLEEMESAGYDKYKKYVK